jgi:two-component system cell cycle sensor histidine kinase/response regulator CckA
MDHAPAGFFSVNEHGQFVFANATLARWLGTTAQELMTGQIKLHDLIQRAPENSHAYDLLTGGCTYQQASLCCKGLAAASSRRLLHRAWPVVKPTARSAPALWCMT